MNHPNILIIDDEEAILDACSMVFANRKYHVSLAKTGEDGLILFKKLVFDLIILDLKLPGINGMEVLRAMKEENQETPVIMITGYATVDSAIEAMKLGAFDYLVKPFSPDELRVVTQKALDSRKLMLENIYLRKELETKTEFDAVIGKSEPIQKVLELARKVSPSDSTVLLTGESGTGKELIARMIHHLSRRAQYPFVVVDCGALVESLFESTTERSIVFSSSRTLPGQ